MPNFDATRLNASFEITERTASSGQIKEARLLVDIQGANIRKKMKATL